MERFSPPSAIPNKAWRSAASCCEKNSTPWTATQLEAYSPGTAAATPPTRPKSSPAALTIYEFVGARHAVPVFLSVIVLVVVSISVTLPHHRTETSHAVPNLAEARRDPCPCDPGHHHIRSLASRPTRPRPARQSTRCRSANHRAGCGQPARPRHTAEPNLGTNRGPETIARYTDSNP